MAWANFKDKTADINDVANYVQGSFQGSMPDPQHLGDHWLKNHPNWLNVDDTWTPPAPVITLDEQIMQIEESYNVKFEALQKRLNTVLLAVGINQDAKTVILQNEYKELSEQKDLELLELLGGI